MNMIPTRKTVRARIVNYDITENQKGDPQVTILFEYNEGDSLSGSSHQITWWGHTSEKAMPYTLKSLYTLGYQGKTMQDFLKLADGVEGGALDLAKEVELVLDQETKETGKTFWKVAFINDPDKPRGGAFKGSMAKDKIKVKLGAMNLEGQMAVVRQELGITATAKSAAKPAPAPAMREPGEDEDFDVGF